jgi:hypothetical protein
MLPLEQSPHRWLLPSPSTSIFSTMQLSDSPPAEKSPYCNDEWTPKHAPRLATTCHVSSKQLQAKLSLSDCSDPGLFEDPLGLWDSDSSMGDDRDYQSDYQVSASDIWDSYWAPTNDFSLPRTPFYRVDSITCPPIHIQDQSFSPTIRKIALYDLSSHQNPEHPNSLRRSDAFRSPRHVPHAHPPLPKPIYSPFPATPQSSQISVRPTRPHTPHRSWPQHNQPQPRPPLRAPAKTTPTASHVKPKVSRPSNLRTCTPITSEPQLPSQPWQLRHPSSTPSFSSRQTTHSAPTSPVYPRAATPLMDLLPQSVFEDSDSDDEEETSKFDSLRKRLHIRGHSGGSHASTRSSTDTDMDTKKDSLGRRGCLLRKSTSECLREMFGIKKDKGEAGCL